MTHALRRALPLASMSLWIPRSAVLAQDPVTGEPFRPYFFVLLAFAAAWLLIAAWVYRIGRKVSALSKAIDEEGD